MNLLFGLPFRLQYNLGYNILGLNILKTEKILQFSEKKFSTCVARHSSARG